MASWPLRVRHHIVVNLLVAVLLLSFCRAQVEDAESGTCSNDAGDGNNIGDTGSGGRRRAKVTLLDSYTHTCRDEHENCLEWANAGECSNNPAFMYTHCRRSCASCDEDVTEPAPAPEAVEKESECKDQHEQCAPWASRTVSECDSNPGYMHKNCKRSCNLCPDQLHDISRGSLFGEVQVLSEHGNGNATEEKLTLKLI